MTTLTGGRKCRERATGDKKGKGRGSSVVDMPGLGLIISGAITRETIVPAILKSKGTDAEEKSSVATDTGEVGRK